MIDWEQLRLEAESATQEGQDAESAWLKVLDAARDFGEADARYVFSLETVAEHYFVHGDFSKAEPHCLKLLELSENKLGDHHPDIGVITTNLGILYHAIEDMDKAESFYKRAWAIRSKEGGTPHPQVLHLIANYSSLLESTGRKAEAEKLKSAGESMKTGKWNRSGHYEAIQAATPPPEVPPTQTVGEPHRIALHIDGEAAENMRAWNLLMTGGEQSMARGDMAKAEQAFKNALDVSRKFDDKDGRLMMSLESLTDVLWQQTKYDEAEPLCKLTLEIYENQLGPNHLDVGVIANNLAMLYHTIAKYDQAEELYKRALTIRTAYQGNTHPDVIMLMNNYANLLASTNRENEARNLKAHIRSLTSGKWNKCGQFQAITPQPDTKARDTANHEELRLSVGHPQADAEPHKPKEKEGVSIYDRLIDVVEKSKQDKRR